mmetsp:Transcript_36087/g.61532  ORF Transcript_36087/g.61532 Transcript_36087/m.61532 type:complete len:104 (-) Transcript_36087:267-578(-)
MDIFATIDPISIAIGVGIGALLVLLLGPKGGSGQINESVQKSEAKVATICPLKDIEDTVTASDKGVVAYCRCWRSKKFPYCDGAHAAHNKATGDNTGPLVIKK